MRDEIETILNVDADAVNRVIAAPVEPDKVCEQARRLVDAADALQQSVPNDLEERREAAAEFLRCRPADEQSPDKILRHIAEYHHGLRDTTLCAYKRILGIHGGNFQSESEYYDDSPEYPEQWLDAGLDESDAEFLLCVLQHGDEPFDDPVICTGAPENLVSDGFVRQDFEREDRYSVYVNSAPFKSGLDLPDFIDEGDLR